MHPFTEGRCYTLDEQEKIYKQTKNIPPITNIGKKFIPTTVLEKTLPSKAHELSYR